MDWRRSQSPPSRPGRRHRSHRWTVDAAAIPGNLRTPRLLLRAEQGQSTHSAPRISRPNMPRGPSAARNHGRSQARAHAGLPGRKRVVPSGPKVVQSGTKWHEMARNGPNCHPSLFHAIYTLRSVNPRFSPSFHHAIHGFWLKYFNMIVGDKRPRNSKTDSKRASPLWSGSRHMTNYRY